VLRTVFFFPSLVPLVAAASLFFFIFLPGVGLLVTSARDRAAWAQLAGRFRHRSVVVDRLCCGRTGYYMLFYIAGLQNIRARHRRGGDDRRRQSRQRLRLRHAGIAADPAFVVVIALIQLLTSVDHVIVLTWRPVNATNLVLYYIFQSAHEFRGRRRRGDPAERRRPACDLVRLLRIMERGTRGAT
jgi:sn-glycerol 3-phosphate transport system permease protein